MIKALIPKPVRAYARQRHQRYILARSIHEFAALPPDATPAPELFSNLVYGWGNRGYSAEQEYLSALVQRARRSHGPVLECGSGLSTLLLGIVAQRAGSVVWTLEHHDKWAEVVRSKLTAFRITSVQLCVAPLRSYGQFDWYDPPLERMPSAFSLVVCDGPPGETRGGRYGLLPVMRELLAPGCVILADDASRAAEQAVLQAWEKDLNSRAEVAGSDKPFATMIVP